MKPDSKKMTRPASISPPGPEFNALLFAPIGEDRNVIPVSVLSALARLDVDPWQEAVTLAQLPGETATRKLTVLIEAQPDKASTYPDLATIAARLIELLPRPAGLNTPSHEASNSVGALINSWPWWIYVIFMSFMLGAQSS